MIDTSQYALILVIEGNNNYINLNTSFRLLEDEAIKCVKSWRKNGGIYSEIEIYCICVSGNVPNKQTIEQLHNYKVTYIEHYMDETKNFKNGWWCKPLGCSILERYLPHKYLIHIDLDMYLYREIKFDLNHNMCLVYDSYDSLSERKVTNRFDTHFKLFNTCFIVAETKYKIFQNWYSCLLKLESSYNSNSTYFKEYFSDIEYCKLEEGAFDIISLEESYNIKAIEDIMFGETYTPLENMNSTNNICFHHYHLYNKYDLNKYNFIKDKLLFINEYT